MPQIEPADLAGDTRASPRQGGHDFAQQRQRHRKVPPRSINDSNAYVNGPRHCGHGGRVTTEGPRTRAIRLLLSKELDTGLDLVLRHKISQVLRPMTHEVEAVPCAREGCRRDFPFDRLKGQRVTTVSYTHLRAHETVLDIVCRLLLEKKKQK